MGREKFKIVTDMDSKYMHDYLSTNEQIIRNEFYESKNVNDRSHFEDLLEVLINMDKDHEEVYSDSMFKSIQTTFLYLLSEERRNKIRTTIRVKRMLEQKDKKQLTIDSATHEGLKKFADDHSTTLSDAIKYLLENYYDTK